MSTRYLTAAYINGEYKIAQYGQSDGYPGGAGVDILRFLSSIKLDVFRKSLQECVWYTDNEISKIEKDNDDMAKMLPSWEWSKWYPELSRDTGSDILSLVLLKKCRKLENRIEFASRSLNCEWAYIIDFDKGTFEVYEGFNKEPLKDGDRFYGFPSQKLHDGKSEYHPVKMIASFPLEKLPTEDIFGEQFNEKEDDE